MPEITRETLIDVLEEIVLLLELKGENPFKIRAYRNGAEVIRNYEGDIVARAKENDLKGIKGIGDALQSKLHELASTGEMTFYTRLKGEFPESLFDLFELQGLGAKKIKALYETLGVDSIATLRKACEEDTISELSGFGKKTVENILKAIEARENYAGQFCHGAIAPLAQIFLERLQDHPKVHQATLCGSFRRGKETSHDLDFLVATSETAELTEFFTAFPEVVEVIACGETKASVVVTEKGLQCDLRAVSNEQFPFAQQYFTGSKEHNVAVRSRAREHGLSLNEYGFTLIEGKQAELPAVNLERDIYSALGLDYIEPELRENRGEIEAAEQGALPRLVELENLRGTFHNHTTESDGGNTLEEMALAAHEHGLQYLGIADHSKASFQANGLDEVRLAKQVEDIAELNKKFLKEGVEMHVFSGSEVDILKDGTLDFGDEVLATLDYCVASVHQPLSQDEQTMTQRVIKAMENPYVTMLGHSTGRLLLRRDPYPINLDKIIDCAAETGTIIELNCSYLRADMDWRWWRRAAEKGVKTSINPDAHSVNGFQNLAFGIKWARKGWLTKHDVMNCLPLDEVKEFLAAQRS